MPLEASRALLRKSRPSTDEVRAIVARIGGVLLAGRGYSPENNRMVVFGADHSCNAPHADHLGRPEMHPHAAMVLAVRCLGYLLNNPHGAGGWKMETA